MQMGDLENDVPLIAKWFSKYILIPLLEKKIIETKLLVWPEINEEMYAFDVYFKVAAEIFKHQNKTMSWKEIESQFIADGASQKFEKYVAAEEFSK